MPDSELPTLCDHCVTANTAFTGEAWRSFSTFSSNVSEFVFHLIFLSMVNALKQLPVSNGQLRDEAEAHQLFCWFLFLVSVGQRTLCRWLFNGGCCVALLQK
jgi:hypothetical protein